MPKSTEEIKNDMDKMNSIEEIIDYMNKELPKTRYGDRIIELCELHKIEVSTLQKTVEGLVSKSQFYAALNGSRNLSREKVIYVALALNATIEEANELLKLARHKELYPKIKEDAIVIFGLKNRKNMYEIYDLLEKVKTL